MLGDVCLDKDGVRAAGAFTEMVNHLKANGKTLSDQLAALYGEYGYYSTNNGYFFCYDPAIMRSIFDGIRGGVPESECERAVYPTAAGRFAIASVRDLSTGFDSGEEDNVARLPR